MQKYFAEEPHTGSLNIYKYIFLAANLSFALFIFKIVSTLSRLQMLVISNQFITGHILQNELASYNTYKGLQI